MPHDVKRCMVPELLIPQPHTQGKDMCTWKKRAETSPDTVPRMTLLWLGCGARVFLVTTGFVIGLDTRLKVLAALKASVGTCAVGVKLMVSLLGKKAEDVALLYLIRFLHVAVWMQLVYNNSHI